MRPGRGDAPRVAGVLTPAIAIVLAVLILCASLFSVLGPPAFAEDGPVEMASAWGYAVAAFTFVLAAIRVRSSDGILGGILVALLCARELDAHKALPVGSLTRSATYVDPANPLLWRLGAAFVVMTVVAAALAFALRAFGRWRRGGMAWDRRVVGSVIAFGLLVVAKGLDGIGRTLGDVGIDLSGASERLLVIAEESLELAAPVLLVAVALDLVLRSRPAARP